MVIGVKQKGRCGMKSVLYKTRNLISIASLLKVPETKIQRLHNDFIRDLEGKRFSHKKFIDFVLLERQGVEWI